jgi:hypothetical protein
VTVRTAPCGWDPDYTCCPSYAGASAELKALAEGVATELLWRLTGRRFGLCEITIRPCRKGCTDGAGLGSWSSGEWAPPYVPYLQGGQWFNASCGSCLGECSCSRLCEIALPGPVASVTSVKINGVVVPPGEYVVHDHRTLVRLGADCWPVCQDLAAEVDDVNGTAFAVTYMQGVPVPLGGRYAAGAYACEILKACTGANGCRLSNRYLLESVSREGVAMRFANPLELLDRGMTGIPEVDAWVHSVNPHKRYERSSVWSVDRMPPRTVTG